MPLDAGAERMAVLVLGSRISDKLYGRAELELAGTLSFAAAIALKNSELVEQLHSAATTDELTGLYNRRALEERLAAEISRSLRHQLHTSVLLLDLDRFKVVNDTMGHAAGDRLLIQIARILRQQCRALDVVGRLGGDEFLVILPMTKPAEAQVFVARVQNSLREFEKNNPDLGPAPSAWASPNLPGTALRSAACWPRPTMRSTRRSAPVATQSRWRTARRWTIQSSPCSAMPSGWTSSTPRWPYPQSSRSPARRRRLRTVGGHAAISLQEDRGPPHEACASSAVG